MDINAINAKYNKTTNAFDIIVLNLTNKFENTNTSNRFSASYREQVNKDLSYTLGMGVQFADLTSNNQTKNTNLTNSFVNYFPKQCYLQYIIRCSFIFFLKFTFLK